MGTVADTFSCFYLSSSITTALLIYTPLPVQAASGLGSFAGNLSLDYLRYFVFSDRLKSHEEIWKNAAINGIAGAVWSSLVKFLPGGNNLFQSLSQYRIQLAGAAEFGLPATYPFATATQFAQAASISAARTAAVHELYRNFLLKMTALLSVDAIGSNSLPALFSWIMKVPSIITDFVEGADSSLGKRAGE